MDMEPFFTPLRSLAGLLLIRLPMGIALLLATCAGALLSLPFWLWDRMRARAGMRPDAWRDSGQPARD